MNNIEKNVINVLTKEHGKFTTDLKLEEIVNRVEKAKKEDDFLILPLQDQAWTIGVGMSAYQVKVDKEVLLDLSIIEVVGYEKVTYKPIEEEVDEEIKENSIEK